MEKEAGQVYIFYLGVIFRILEWMFVLFDTLDLFSGYRQIPVGGHCNDLTRFTFKISTFRLEVMLFVLMKISAAFQRMVN